MSAEKKFTERDLTFAKREAYEHGLTRGAAREFKCTADIYDAAVRAYPLPKVQRQRVVCDRFGAEWRVSEINGQLEWRYQALSPDPWQFSLQKLVVESTRVALWADLFACPTEWVEADE